MPVYCFTSDDGVTIEEVFSIHEERPASIERGGVVYRRDVVAEQRGYRATPGNWPQLGTALEVNAEDSVLMMKKCDACGVPTEYRNGQPVYRDKTHKRQHLALMGFHDRNAGYSERAPD